MREPRTNLGTEGFTHKSSLVIVQLTRDWKKLKTPLFSLNFFFETAENELSEIDILAMLTKW